MILSWENGLRKAASPLYHWEMSFLKMPASSYLRLTAESIVASTWGMCLWIWSVYCNLVIYLDLHCCILNKCWRRLLKCNFRYYLPFHRNVMCDTTLTGDICGIEIFLVCPLFCCLMMDTISRVHLHLIYFCEESTNQITLGPLGEYNSFFTLLNILIRILFAGM